MYVFLAFFQRIPLNLNHDVGSSAVPLYQGVPDYFSRGTHQLRTIAVDISLQITDQLRAILRLR